MGDALGPAPEFSGTEDDPSGFVSSSITDEIDRAPATKPNQNIIFWSVPFKSMWRFYLAKLLIWTRFGSLWQSIIEVNSVHFAWVGFYNEKAYVTTLEGRRERVLPRVLFISIFEGDFNLYIMQFQQLLGSFFELLFPMVDDAPDPKNYTLSEFKTFVYKNNRYPNFFWARHPRVGLFQVLGALVSPGARDRKYKYKKKYGEVVPKLIISVPVLHRQDYYELDQLLERETEQLRCDLERIAPIESVYFAVASCGPDHTQVVFYVVHDASAAAAYPKWEPRIREYFEGLYPFLATRPLADDAQAFRDWIAAYALPRPKTILRSTFFYPGYLDPDAPYVTVKQIGDAFERKVDELLR